MSSDLNPTEPHDLTTLKSLQRHAPSQEGLIQSPPEENTQYYFRAVDSKRWKAFWEVAWGREPDSLDGREEVERGPNPVDNFIFPLGVAPTHRHVMAVPENTNNVWAIKPKYKQILIRSEYKEAEQSAVSTCGTGSDVLAITGQPGIGPSPLYSAIARS